MKTIMRHRIACILLLLPTIMIGQIDFENETWHLPCDTDDKQQNMNVCSFQKAEMADSLMNVLYERIVTVYSLKIADLITANAEIDSSMIEYYKDLLVSIKTSQSKFVEYRESLMDVETIENQGGSIMSFMINTAHLKATIERIKWIDSKLPYNQRLEM